MSSARFLFGGISPLHRAPSSPAVVGLEALTRPPRGAAAAPPAGAPLQPLQPVPARGASLAPVASSPSLASGPAAPQGPGSAKPARRRRRRATAAAAATTTTTADSDSDEYDADVLSDVEADIRAAAASVGGSDADVRAVRDAGAFLSRLPSFARLGALAREAGPA
jgi:hypothetical protein